MAPTAILVLGMHRSGTSAATRVVNLLGASVGNDLLGAKDDNPEGFWEHARLVAINEKILLALKLYWDATVPLPKDWLTRPEIVSLKDDAVAFLREEFAGTKHFVLKDPRLCRLLPFWLEALQVFGATPKVLMVFRSPWEVAGSLSKRDQFPSEKSLLLCAWHTLEAERLSRNLSRTAIAYHQLLQSPVKIAEQLSAAFGLKAPNAMDIESFIQPTMRHNVGKLQTAKTAPMLDVLIEHVEALEAKLAHDAAPSTEVMTLSDATYNELLALTAAASTVMQFWHEEAMRVRAMGTELHEKNMRIIELEKQVVPMGQQLTSMAMNYDFVLNNYKLVKQDLERCQSALVAVRASTSWKVTAPMRLIIRIARMYKKFLKPYYYQKAYAIFKHYGFRAFIHRLIGFLWNPELGEGDYQDWLAQYDSPPRETVDGWAQSVDQFILKPRFSVVMPTYNVAENWLREAIESVRKQIYPHWELCIADDASTLPHVRRVLEEYAANDKRIKVMFRETNGHISESSNSALSLATGDYVVLMDHDDLIPDTALFWVATEINRYPNVDMLYSDEDKVDTAGKRFHVHFKPDWNLDLMFATNAFSHLGVYRRTLLEKIGGFRKGYEGAQDYDLLLRALLEVDEKNIRHIPRVLYHWRTIPGSTSLGASHKNYAEDAGVRTLKQFLSQRYPDKRIEIAPTIIPTLRRLIWPVPENPPLVSLLIPTRNKVEVLAQCIRSILKKTVYPNYEIIIVDNQSDESATLKFFEQIQAEDKRVRVIPYPHPFNYSAINNFAASHAKGEIIGLLNNDVEAIDHDLKGRCWLTEMVSLVVRKEVGAVGAKLYYPDGTVQHGGVLIGMGRPDEAVAGHLGMGLRKEDPGYFGRAIVTQELSAVTAACMLMRKEVFDQVSGLDEKNLAVAFNDVDLCLKIREAGYKILWTPFAELIHYESYSRGKEDTPEKVARAQREIDFMRSKWSHIIMNDPFYNPNLDYLGGRFLLAFPPRTVL